MKTNFKILIPFILMTSCITCAQTDLIFNNGFEHRINLNDTGITYAGEYPSGNNPDCNSSTISAQQDCHHGRDFTDNNNDDGHAGFSFTKLDSNGDDLTASAATWSCVRDNVTGLVWEVKTDDGSIHDKDIFYRWGGITHQGDFGTEYYDDWDSLVEGSNNNSFCGFNDWRVPTRQQLKSLINSNTFQSAIDEDYFPNADNTVFSRFWTASPSAKNLDNAWFFAFDFGSLGNLSRSDSYGVRLVRFDQ